MDFKKYSGITLCTVRPKKLEGHADWNVHLRNHIGIKGVSVTLQYAYFSLPYFGPVISQTKTVKLA
jgi:hypothetical protein